MFEVYSQMLGERLDRFGWNDQCGWNGWDRAFRGSATETACVRSYRY